MKGIIGVDLFAGAGGLSLGAELAGVNVISAVENDIYAAETYKFNHPETFVFNQDIKSVNHIFLAREQHVSILFGGPPCQGFSTSNQQTRNKSNPKNWLFQEFIRIAKNLEPNWIVFENVKGIRETEKGFFEKIIESCFLELGYYCTVLFPCASDFGVPQKRNRFFLIGSKERVALGLDAHKTKAVTVREAFEDLPSLTNGANVDVLPYRIEARSDYAKRLRQGRTECSGNLVSRNAEYVINRYKYIPQGGNWKNIPDELMQTYTDKSRCHTGVYKRLNEDEPSTIVGNYRKSMLIHPWEDRGLSVREAARLQSFPDWYEFKGSIGYQQQQVGNAVPPLLAKAVFEEIVKACK